MNLVSVLIDGNMVKQGRGKVEAGGRGMEIKNGPVVEQRSRRMGIRWWICTLLFLASTINYMDRALVGVLKPTLQKELGWNEIDFSNVIFWFQVAYAAGYLFAGRIIDLIGVRIGYALAVVFWSLAAMAHRLRGRFLDSAWRDLDWDWPREGIFPRPSNRSVNGFPGKSARWPRDCSMGARASARC